MENTYHSGMLLTTGNNNKIIQLTVALKKKKNKWLLALIHQSMMPSKARLYLLRDHPQHWLLVLMLDLPKVGRKERETWCLLSGKKSCLRNPHETFACNSLGLEMEHIDISS